MRILALDPASTTGFACRTPQGLRYGAWDCHTDGKHQNLGTMMLRLEVRLERVFKAYPDIRVVMFERVVRATYNFAPIYGALSGEILKFCNRHGIASDSVSPAEWRKSIGLKGKQVAGKDSGPQTYVPFLVEKLHVPRTEIFNPKGKVKPGMEDAMAACGILLHAETLYGYSG